MQWLRQAGEHCEQASTYLMCNLQVEQAQLDELWTFVYKKQTVLSAWEKMHTEWGDTARLSSRRSLVSRLRQRDLTFSRKRESLAWHLYLAVACYHFVHPHARLRCRLPQSIPTRGNGSPKKWEPRTPAMAGGLTDHVWTMKELLTFRVPVGAGYTLLRR